MSYLQRDELVAGLSERTAVQLSNDEPDAKSVNPATIDAAIEYASERVDAALRARYVLPLHDTPTLLRALVLDVARFWLYSRRPETRMPETVKERYAQALKDLEAISHGKLHLGIAEVSGSSKNDVLPDVSEYEVRGASKIDTSGY